MEYVDGFIVPVPRANRDAYREVAARASAIFRKHGALRVVECWADDVPDGEVTSFPMSVKCTEDEVCVFSWIVWPSREARDDGNKKVMADPDMNIEMKNIPFDSKRMIFGGFNVILDE